MVVVRKIQISKDFVDVYKSIYQLNFFEKIILHKISSVKHNLNFIQFQFQTNTTTIIIVALQFTHLRI